MQDYTAPSGAVFNDTISQPQDVLDDVVVATVNPTTSILLDNCSVLYSAQAMTAFSGIDTVTVSGDIMPFSVIGYGANVGMVYVNGGDTIASSANNGEIILSHTLAVDNTTGVWAFAQNETGLTVIGTGDATTQTIWRSADGGYSWTEIAYPGSALACTDVIVYYDRFTGDWYIGRNGTTGSKVSIYRSVDDGVTWSLMSSTLAWGGTANAVTFAIAEDGTFFANTDYGVINTTFSSTDHGATWSNAYAPASRYVHSVVEHKGDIFAAGYNSAGNAIYWAKRESGTWVQQTIGFPTLVSGDSPKVFSRMTQTVGPLIFSVVLTSTTGPTETFYWVASKDGGQNWRYINADTSEYFTKWQARSPGGVHYGFANSSTAVVRVPLELW